jgi:uncharacterized Zn finger protein
MKITVTCLSCGEKVEVVLVQYGDGHIATCPKCGELAYSGE